MKQHTLKKGDGLKQRKIDKTLLSLLGYFSLILPKAKETKGIEKKKQARTGNDASRLCLCVY